MTNRICSFPPVAKPDARILILGSMPGQASLDANQYYAHPRNLFWRIMGELTGAGPDVAYDKRMDILISKQIALWDVLQSCVREGSLDADIEEEVANDFPGFFKSHPQITHIFFNGQKAFKTYKSCDFVSSATLHVLPSTSPAHAALSFDDKLQMWSKILSV